MRILTKLANASLEMQQIGAARWQNFWLLREWINCRKNV